MTSSSPDNMNIPASVRNAPDLTELKQSTDAQTTPTNDSSTEPTWRYDVESTEDFQQLIQQSSRGAVVFAMYAEHSPASLETLEHLEKLINSAQGSLLLAAVDITKQPEIAQAFQVQGVPAAVAVIAGQPAPMFNSQVTLEQLTDLLQQLLQISAQQQLPGGFEPKQPVEEKPLPPLHQEAVDAIDRGDFDAATAAYRKALNENPGDADAKIGLAQVGLLSRVQGFNLAEERERAAQDPRNVEAAFNVADLDVSGGHVEDAFNRLINLFKAVDAEQKNAVRERLLELFEVVGAHDPRVSKARADLMMALF
ncbi:MAG: tetratricopeptide repeat protein [Rothia sp. (in: high G+C Gram-positive bacteria)]|nr:tetratricopeptide repeat protein [Rothia sp. (in: high G+C Gram-positive bacteria)]